MKNIPQVKIGNEIYDIKDTTCREHLIEVKEGTTPPTDVNNKLWIKKLEHTYLVPEYHEFVEVKDAVEELDAPFLTEEELDEICRGGDN